MPKIFIAVPTHRSMMDTACALSIGSLLYNLGFNRIGGTLTHLNGHDIAWSRDRLVAYMLADPTFTHLLFSDSDMVYPPSLFDRLWNAQKEVIGCVYPHPLRNAKTALSAVAQAARSGLDDNAAIGTAAGFIGDTNVPFDKDGIAEVGTIGMGLCLIARSAFEKLLATGKIPQSLWRDDQSPNGARQGFFQNLLADGTVIGEDASFCRRWRELCGGKIYALASKEIGHIARVEVRASPVQAVPL